MAVFRVLVSLSRVSSPSESLWICGTLASDNGFEPASNVDGGPILEKRTDNLEPDWEPFWRLIHGCHGRWEVSHSATIPGQTS